MKTKFALVFMILTAMLVPQSLVLGQSHMRGGWGGMFGGPEMAAYLGLTQDQMSQLKTMRSSQRTTIQPLMQKLGTYQQQLRQMTETTTKMNTAQVQTLAAQIAQVQAQLTVARAQMEWQVFNTVLTGDQQGKLIQFQQQLQQMRQNHQNAESASPNP